MKPEQDIDTTVGQAVNVDAVVMRCPANSHAGFGFKSFCGSCQAPNCQKRDMEVQAKEADAPKMSYNTILHQLRNPYGLDKYHLRNVRLAAADEIEKWHDAYQNLRCFAEKRGIDTTTFG